MEEEWEIKTQREWVGNLLSGENDLGFPLKRKRDIYLTEKVRGGKIH